MKVVELGSTMHRIAVHLMQEVSCFFFNSFPTYCFWYCEISVWLSVGVFVFFLLSETFPLLKCTLFVSLIIEGPLYFNILHCMNYIQVHLSHSFILNIVDFESCCEGWISGVSYILYLVFFTWVL